MNILRSLLITLFLLTAAPAWTMQPKLENIGVDDSKELDLLQQNLPLKKIADLVAQSPITREFAQQGIDVTCDFSARKYGPFEFFLGITIWIQKNKPAFENIGYIYLNCDIDPTTLSLTNSGEYSVLRIMPKFRKHGYAQQLIPLGIGVFDACDITRRRWIATPLDKETKKTRLVGLYQRFGGTVTRDDELSTDMHYEAPSTIKAKL
jgi:hypothetical protein